MSAGRSKIRRVPRYVPAAASIVAIASGLTLGGARGLTPLSTTPPAAMAPASPAQASGPAPATADKIVTQSGLPWMSGSNTLSFAGFRGRPLDVATTWEDDGTWQGTEVVWALKDGALANFRGRLSIAVPMLSNSSDSLAACARGAYDKHFVALGKTLKRYHRPASYVRIGWEGNGTWFPWSVGNDPATWVRCFQREVRALRSTDPQAQIEWAMNKDSRVDVRTMYPGDAYVNIIGVDFYDAYPTYDSLDAWNADYNSTSKGGPQGLGSWLRFAHAHRKQLSLPEWGVQNRRDAGKDNPFFIRKMFQFFSANATSIAYESYFNSDCPDFCLVPAEKNPKSAAMYKQLW